MSVMRLTRRRWNQCEMLVKKKKHGRDDNKEEPSRQTKFLWYEEMNGLDLNNILNNK